MAFTEFVLTDLVSTGSRENEDTLRDISGTVTLTPLITGPVRVPDDPAWTLTTAPITLTMEGGKLVGRDSEEGVRLVAMVDGQAIPWKIERRLVFQGKSISTTPVTVVSTGEPVHLPDAAPVDEADVEAIGQVLVNLGAVRAELAAAVDAATRAEDAAAGIGADADRAVDAEHGAVAARTGAESARDEAVAARADAVSARNGAEVARDGAEAAAVRAEAVASGGGIIVVSSEEEAAALPVGTVYVIAAEVTPGEPDTPVTIVGTVGENITTDTFTPTIPNATTGDTIIIAANTKAVGGSTLTAPTGFTTLVDGYWVGTQQSWVLTGPWSDDLTITADQPLEFGYAAVAVRGATSVTAGTVKHRTEEPTESTTVTAPAVERGTNDLAIGIAFERTSANETAEQVTVNEGWTIEHYTAQGTNFQTTLIGVGGTGDMVVTYPNVQATNGAGVQVVAHA